MDIRKKLEQIRRNKRGTKPSVGSGISKTRTNVGDLRQLIAKKTNKKVSNTRDLRETNKKLTRRKSTTTISPVTRNDLTRPMTTRATTKRSAGLNQTSQRQHQQHMQQQFYVPPPMRRNQSTFTPAPTLVAPKSAAINGPAEHHSGGASVLISNLNPTITQSDIIELYGEIGVLSAVNMINQTTALVTYNNSGDAFRAVKVYHNRLLDGRPMLVNMMPTGV